MRLSLDLELSPRTGQLLAAGWVLDLGDEVRSGRMGSEGLGSLLDLLRGLEAAGGTLVGHNIRAFDLPHLWQLAKGRPQAEVSLDAYRFWPEIYGGAVLDTLELSPLLWPGKPKHALEKLYRHQTAINDPVADARETLERLQEAREWLGAHPPRPVLRYWWDKLLPQGALRDFLLGDGEATSMLEAATDLGDFDGEMMQRLWLHLENLPQHQPENLGALVALHWLLSRHRPSHRRPAWVEHRWPSFTAAEAAALGEADLSEAALTQELRDIYGPDWSFRSGQLELVQALLTGESIPLGLLPTGGGKSLTFQFPALYLSRRNRSLTVVVSPLVALMEDQVISLQTQLPDYAERVAYLSGTQSPDDQRAVLAGVWEGRIDLLYLSPERLRNTGVQRLLAHRRPALWVLDEAHTLSQWGMDFRPDFQRIAGQILDIHRDSHPPLLGLLTATATARVLDDLTEYLVRPLAPLLGERALVRLPEQQPSPWRTNIETQLIQMPKAERLAAARADLLAHVGDGRVSIVYVNSRNLAEAYAQDLGADGSLRTAAFHARIASTDKREILRRFKDGELDVVVATSAFGMGIDRAGIHTVIHMGPPSTAESYLQEIGRVARKQGEEGRAILYWETADFVRSLHFDATGRIGRDNLKKCWTEAQKVLRQPTERRWISTQNFEKPLGVSGEELLTQSRVALRTLEAYGLLQEGQQQPAELTLRLLEPPVSVLGLEGQRLADWVSASQGWQVGAALSLDIMQTSLLSALTPQGVLQAARQLVSAGWAEWSYRVTVRLRVTDQGRGRLYRMRVSVRDLLAQWDAQQVTPEALEQVNTERVTADLKKKNGKEVSLDFALCGLRALELIHVRKNGAYLTIKPSKGAPPLSAWSELTTQRFAELRRVWDELGRLKQEDGNDTLTLDMAQLERLGGDIADFGPLETLLALEHLGMIDVARGDEAAAHIFRLNWGKRGERAVYHQKAFSPLENHYQDRSRRIHVMRLFVQLEPQERRAFIEDYFALPLDEFCRRYDPEHADELGLAQLPGTQKRILGGLSDVQRRIVTDSSSRALLVLAGPGSGKTRVVVHRTAALLALENVPPEQILILAYNCTAVAEVRERLGALLAPLGLSYRPKVLTFHGLARELTQLKASDAPPEALAELAQEQRQQGRNLSKEDLANRWLLGQLIEHLAENEVAYRYILVDEYQDIDEQKYQIINRLTDFHSVELSDEAEEDQHEQQSYLVAVGDDDQNIYGFQGAKAEYIQRFRDDYQIRPEQDVYLTDNYRSSPEIVAFNNAFIAASLTPEQRLKGPEHAIVSRVTEGGKVGFCTYPADAKGAYAAAYTVARKIKGLVARGMQPHEIAVLAPTWDDLHAVQHALRLAEIGTQPFNTADHLRPVESLLGQHLLDQLQAAPTTLCADPAAELTQLAAPYSTQDRSFDALRAALAGLSETSYEVMATRLRGAKPLQPKAVALSTFHSAKGSEFEQVFVLDTGKDARHREEARRDDATRALYVALTRARRGLFILSKEGGGHPTFTAEWLKETLGLDVTPQATPPHHWPTSLRYTIQLEPCHLYLSHRQVISAAGRRRIDDYAQAWEPLHMPETQICWRGGVVAALSQEGRKILEKAKSKGAKVLSVHAEQLFYCARDDRYYGDYAGPEDGHFLVLPSLELEEPFDT